MSATTYFDCTDFRILELYQFDPKWYFFKFNGPGLKCEITISISTGQEVWTHGLFECGTYNELAIFNLELQKMQDRDEFAAADRGYTRRNIMTSRYEPENFSRFHVKIRVRHETFNRRLKQVNELSHPFQHDICQRVNLVSVYSHSSYT